MRLLEQEEYIHADRDSVSALSFSTDEGANDTRKFTHLVTQYYAGGKRTASMPDGERQRAIAQCRSCCSAYAVNIWSDGTIRPIGRRSCDCGSTEFEVIGDIFDSAFQDDTVD